MKHHLLHLKKIGMLLAFLILGVMTGQAAYITYSLTTHVDGRTITEEANLSEGASLKDNMPQDLWRAYCTYTYYSDASLTQKITTVPAEDATVYVNYVFDPPFILSEEGKNEVWHYLRSYNAGGTSNHIVYYRSKAEDEIGQRTIRAYEGNKPPTPDATANGMMAKKGHAEWAFYGDAYDFHIKVNDSSLSKQWLIWTSTSTSEAPLRLGDDPSLGWQLYTNTASNDRLSSGTVCLGVPETTNYLASLENLDYYVETDGLDTSKQKFNKKNELINVVQGTTSNKNGLWWYAFFATPVSSTNNYPPVLWHVTYKIQKVDGTWYDDIVVQKSSSNLTPTWPVPGFTPVNDCEYDYFYTDATFTEKFEGAMPSDCNSTLFIKEIEEEIITQPWITLVLPFTINDVDDYFGPGAVEVDEYTSVEGHLRQSNGEELFICHLTFTPTTKIEAYKPYLFKANEVRKSQLTEMYATEGKTTECIPVLWDDQTNAKAKGIFVSMKGVLETEGTEIDNSDGLKFYFTSKYDESIEDYRYGFIRSKASFTIPKNRCYFYVVDERSVSPSGAPLTLSFDGSGFTGIGQMVIEGTTVSSKIYNINGQLMRVGSTNDLPKGIYIANGKKFIVK